MPQSIVAVKKKRPTGHFIHPGEHRDSPRQIRPPHQPLVHGAGALAALSNGPYYQRLAAAHVAGGEDAGNGGVVCQLPHTMLQKAAMQNTPDTETVVILWGYRCGRIRCRTSATTLVDTRKLVLLRSCLIATSKSSHSRSVASAINPKVPTTRKPTCSATHLPSLSSIRTKSAL